MSFNPSSVPILEFRGLVKRFGDNCAVNDVSFQLRQGEILALLGQNGAGKSTLIKLLAGIHAPSSGQILLNNEPLHKRHQDSEIAFIHQDLGLIEWMTVAENLALGLRFQRRFGLINWRATGRKAREILERVGGGIDPETRIFRLSRTERSLVAIARALASNAKLLVLDEPTSSLTSADVDRLFEVLSALKEKGVAMIFVSHRLDEVFRIADRMVVMRDGRVVGACPTSETSPDHLVDLIVGQRLASKYPKAPAPATTDAALDVRDLRIGPLPEVSFRARKGELLALTGLKGAGQREIGRALFGLEPWRGGSVLLGSRPVTFSSPLEAIRNGIGYASANRHDDSLALPLSVRENFFLNPTHRGIPFHRPILPAAEKQEAWRWTKLFGVRPADPEAAVETLSGGNQQKVVLGRWLKFSAQILILEEPTIGVDVGARADIYRLIATALQNGLTVLMLSTDLEEVENISHRALVFNRGRIVAELEGDSLTMSELVRTSSGG